MCPGIVAGADRLNEKELEKNDKTHQLDTDSKIASFQVV